VAGKFKSVGPGSETIIGGVVSSDSFLDRGHQVDLEMMNVDSLINRANQLAPDVGQYQTWKALKADWDKYYQANVASPPILPWVSDSDLSAWLDRVAEWKTRAAAWAAKTGDAGFAQVAANVPTSPAMTTHQEDLAKPSPLANPWVKLGVVGGVLLGMGWLASSVAKVVRG
jgi:hypothetical protein